MGFLKGLCPQVDFSKVVKSAHGQQTTRHRAPNPPLNPAAPEREPEGMVAARMANMGQGGYKLKDANLRVSQPEAADKLNVSERTVNTAKAVQRTGIPKLVAAVDAGEVVEGLSRYRQRRRFKKGGQLSGCPFFLP